MLRPEVRERPKHTHVRTCTTHSREARTRFEVLDEEEESINGDSLSPFGKASLIVFASAPSPRGRCILLLFSSVVIIVLLASTRPVKPPRVVATSPAASSRPFRGSPAVVLHLSLFLSPTSLHFGYQCDTPRDLNFRVDPCTLKSHAMRARTRQFLVRCATRSRLRHLHLELAREFSSAIYSRA